MHHIQVLGEGREFRCSESTSLLSAMVKKGINCIPIGCRSGGCGVCKIRVLSGSFTAKVMSRKHLTLTEEGEGMALACRVFPKSSMVVEVVENKSKKLV